jgi:hypothetical protein
MGARHVPAAGRCVDGVAGDCSVVVRFRAMIAALRCRALLMRPALPGCLALRRCPALPGGQKLPSDNARLAAQ